MSIQMDSWSPSKPKPDAEQNNAIQLIQLLASTEVATHYENRLRAGGMGYSDLKKGLFEGYWSHFAAFRERRAELAAKPDYVRDVLEAGARRARVVASETLAKAKAACGLC